MGQGRFLHALNYCMLLPGPEAQQLAIYIGWLLNGTRGGLLAGILFVLPGVVALLVLSAIYVGYGDTAAVNALFLGLDAAVIAIVVQAVVRVSRRALTAPAPRGAGDRRVRRTGLLRGPVSHRHPGRRSPGLVFGPRPTFARDPEAHTS